MLTESIALAQFGFFVLFFSFSFRFFLSGTFSFKRHRHCYTVSYKLVLTRAYLKFGETLMAFVKDFSSELLSFSSFLLFWLFHLEHKTIKFYFFCQKFCLLCFFFLFGLDFVIFLEADHC